MPRLSIPPRLTFEDAMSVHVLRAQGMTFSELTHRFGVNPARFYEVLCGTLHPGSWASAVERLTGNDHWHAEIASAVECHGLDDVLTALSVANPSKKQFERELRRLRKAKPVHRPIGGARGAAPRRGPIRRSTPR